MRRFFVEHIGFGSARVELRGGQLRHLRDVLRLGAGERVALFNGRGVELIGRIESVGPDRAVVAVDSAVEPTCESPVRIVLLQGLGKGLKPEFIIQKTTELGLSAVSFFFSRRSVPVYDAARAAERLRRWRRVAVEAAKQCGRSMVPEVALTDGLDGALGRAGPWERDTLRVVLSAGERRRGLKELLADGRGRVRSVIAVIGPEGGLTEEELSTARKAGFEPAGLGPRILRTETAAVAVAAVIQYELGDMGAPAALET
ncbi:MAG TPA: 16S rRNA (uracil(1498)-N(3))-methyltransferase [Deltaproteobacteria bacterium]|nr:16S rRNA (uracil(1498)-N(3))-methyltransferase [Deltaproteobacteria bacterium]